MPFIINKFRSKIRLKEHFILIILTITTYTHVGVWIHDVRVGVSPSKVDNIENKTNNFNQSEDSNSVINKICNEKNNV